MTPGQEALAEAARLEAARVYGRVIRENKEQPVSVTAAVAEAELVARKPRADEPDDLVIAVRSGLTNSQIITAFHCEYSDVRAARKRAMKGAA